MHMHLSRNLVLKLIRQPISRFNHQQNVAEMSENIGYDKMHKFYVTDTLLFGNNMHMLGHS